ncbi:MAG: ACP S-malonyltransferase [Acidimicrobiia bacterium]
MRYAVLFPGQGSQFVGMGAELFRARPDLLEEQADQALGWSLRGVCLEGPEEELSRTDRAQPALYALSYTLWEAFAAAMPEAPTGAAGHSLGEYTALAAAGVFDFFTGLRLVAARGEAMAAAGQVDPSGMVALLGVEAEEAQAIAERRRAEGGRLWVANLNAPGQVVLAGSALDVAWVVDHAAALRVRRAVPLKVAGAFHSPYMAPAAERLRAALAAVTFQAPAFPVWSNVAARPVVSEEMESLLSEQLVAPVRFADTLTGMAAAGAEAFVHVGPGDVTAGMARRSAPRREALVVGGLGDIEEAVSRLSEP